MKGVVVKNTGSWYQVKSADGELIDCKIKGNLRLKDIRSTNPIAVGDMVDFEMSSDIVGLISDVRDRRNYIVRRSSNLSKHAHILAANLDLTVLVATVNYPETSTVFIDRFWLLPRLTECRLVWYLIKQTSTRPTRWNTSAHCRSFISTLAMLCFVYRH